MSVFSIQIAHRASRLAATLLFLVAGLATAQEVVWSDGFESYDPQSVTNREGLGGDSDAPGIWTDFGGQNPFHIDGSFANTGSNALRLDEGQADILDGYGSDASINLPEVYTSGNYTLTFASFASAALDTYHSVAISQTTYPITNLWPTGIFIETDAQGFLGDPSTYALQALDADFAPTVVKSADRLVAGRWVENVVNIDLDNNLWDWTLDGASVVSSTQWSEGDGAATLGSLDLYVGLAFAGANENGITGSVYYDDFVLTRNVSAGLVCDADGDGDCDHADIDALYAAFGTSGPLDLDGSGSIDTDDIDDWLSAASSPANPYKENSTDVYEIGDVDLSGEVNSTDLGLLLNNFNATGDVTYGQGNLNGTDGVNSTDLGLLLNNFGATSPSANAVPEPSSGVLLMLMIACLASRVRRRV